MSDPTTTPAPVPRVDLASVLRAAADGRFPPADGGFSRTRPWRDGVEAAVALTGHAVLAVGEDVPDERLVALGVHGLGGAHDPRVAVALAGRGEVGVLDVLLVGRGTGGGGTPPRSGPAPAAGVVERPDLGATHRVRHARAWRDDVLVLGLADRNTTALATLSRGIAGLPEVGLEAPDAPPDVLLAGALSRVPQGEVVLASVTPGNARSLRWFLRRGFVPVGSVQQWRPVRA